jgi:hypothetical protein
MLPKWHILIGFVFSYILVYFLDFSLLAGAVVFVSSWFLIDLDHFIFYICKTKDLSVKKFLEYSQDKARKWKSLSCEERLQCKYPVFIFHSLEFWIVLALLSVYFKIFLLILAGFAVHIAADYIMIFYEKSQITPKFSLALTLFRNKEKKTIL